MKTPVIFRVLQLIILATLFCVNAAYAKDMGEKVYQISCKACHAKGSLGAPKYGDKADWAERLQQGFDVLAGHAIGGYKGKTGVMPPRGGNRTLSDDDVKAAVKYMLDSVME